MPKLIWKIYTAHTILCQECAIFIKKEDAKINMGSTWPTWFSAKDGHLYCKTNIKIKMGSYLAQIVFCQRWTSKLNTNISK